MIYGTLKPTGSWLKVSAIVLEGSFLQKNSSNIEVFFPIYINYYGLIEVVGVCERGVQRKDFWF